MQHPSSDDGLPKQQPRRPPPPPPTPPPPPDETLFIPVDGLTPSQLESFFQQADADHDGRVADEEARAFFLRSGLSPADLSAIWRAVKPPSVTAQQGKGLSRRRFSQALRLIALVQSGLLVSRGGLTPAAAVAAMTPQSWGDAKELSSQLPTLPPPIFHEQEEQQQVEQQPENADEASVITGLEFLGIAPPQQQSQHQQAAFASSISSHRRSMMPPQRILGQMTISKEEDEDNEQEDEEGDDIFGLGSALPLSTTTSAEKKKKEGGVSTTISTSGGRRPPPPLPPPPRKSLSRIGVMKSVFRSTSRHFISTSTTPPLAYELRYPPLNPKESSKLSLLTSMCGALMSGPSVDGGMLYWSVPDGEAIDPLHSSRRNSTTSPQKKMFSRLESNLRVTHETQHHVASEDADGAPCIEVLISPRRAPVTSTHPDEPNNLLWVGDKEGWVGAFEVSDAARLAPQDLHRNGRSCLCSFQAHRVGAVTALCLTPTGELWTASSRGSIRVWRFAKSTTATTSLFGGGGGGSGSGGGSGGGLFGRSNSNSSSTSSASKQQLKEYTVLGKPKELRRGAGERAHAGPIVALVCSADGQVVWSASRRHVGVWDSRTGLFLGVLSRSSSARSTSDASTTPTTTTTTSAVAVAVATPTSPVDPRATTPSLASTLDTQAQQTQQQQQQVTVSSIHPSFGLDVNAANGVITARPAPAERERLVAQQEAWAAQSDRGVAEFAERLSEGAGKAVKFMGKLGIKIASGIGTTTTSGSGASGAGGGGSIHHSTTMSEYDEYEQQQQQQNSAAAAAAATVAVDGVGAHGDIVGIVCTPTNTMWVAYRRGVIEAYTSSGRLLFTRQFGNGRIYAISPVGRRVWLGFTNGMLSVLSADGTGLKAFLGHRAGIISIAAAGPRVFTLAADGSINGWSAAIPCPEDDDAVRAWRRQVSGTYVRQSLHVLAVTWNCGESKPDPGSAVFRWIHEHGYDKSLVVVGLQEVEMGGTSVALAAAKNALAARLQEKGNSNAQFWSGSILNALGGDRHWHQVGLRQLSGMLIVVFARNNLRGHIGEIATASVACGVLGVGGNKGAVAVEFTLHRQKFAAVCSHFAAHQNAVAARNSNYAIISKHLSFNRRAMFTDDGLLNDGGEDLFTTPPHVVEQMKQEVREGKRAGASSSSDDDEYEGDERKGGTRDLALQPPTTPTPPTPTTALIQGEGLRSAGALVWMGDFNYRIDGQYDQVKELVLQGELGPLLACDQLLREKAAGRVFVGMKEPDIGFPPTYKFDKGVPSPAAYDSSEKRRVPAWCDRIFYRGSKSSASANSSKGTKQQVAAAAEGEAEEDEKEEEEEEDNMIRLGAKEYGCWGDVYDSDHRPVYCHLEASLPVTNAEKKRAVIADVLRRYAPPAIGLGADTPPEVSISAGDGVKLHPIHTPSQMVVLSNSGVAAMRYEVLLPVGPDGCTCDGSYLEVRPMRGVIDPGEDVELTIRTALGGAGSYASTPRQVTVQVLLLGREFGCGGGGGSTVEFHVTVLPEFSMT